MRNLALSAGILGLTGVLLGAVGAHALKGALLEHGTRELWETAALYQLVHAAALLALAGCRARGRPESGGRDWLGHAGLCWSVGVLLFSGSLYGLALGGPRLLGPITPLGGAALIAGWGCVIAYAATVRSHLEK